MAKAIKRELGIFLIVGLLTVGIDFFIYRSFIYMEPFGAHNINTAKGIGFIGGTLFAYFANRFWTFKDQTTRSGSAIRFILVYLLGLATNILINYLFVNWFSSSFIAQEVTLLIAFILATGVSATLNFIGMKFFVFTDRKLGNASE